MRKSREQDSCHEARKYFREYTELTGIHGLRYIIEKRSRTEKIFWGILLLCSLGGCIFMIYEIVDKFINSPVIVSFATTETPIFQIPFPAVTICPESKASVSKFNYTKLLLKVFNNQTEELTEEEKTWFIYMEPLCDFRQLYNMEGADHINVTHLRTVGEDFFEFLQEVKPDPGLLFMDGKDFQCSFMGYRIKCLDLFVPVITDEGLCYSFNILDRDEIFNEQVYRYSNFSQVRYTSESWQSDNGYLETAGIDTHPARALFSGIDNALTVHLALNKTDIDYNCKLAMQGFRVLLHNPVDIPRLSKHYFRVPLGYAVVAEVIPKLVQTSSKVQSFSPSARQCYFQTERPLKYFRRYSQDNCQLECLTNYTLKACKCVTFFMPRDNATDICGVGSFSCMNKAENNLKMEEVQVKLSNPKESRPQCDCKPLCTDLSYSAETSPSEWQVLQHFRFLGRDEEERRVLSE